MVYDAKDIEVLDSVAAVRRRPGMYIGDVRDGSGLHHLLWELVGNALDEHLAGHAKKIRVSIEGDLAEVEDDGRGIPVDPCGYYGTRLERALTGMHFGATEDGHAPHVHVSPLGAGVGLAPVNALCESFDVVVWRDGYEWRVQYARGRPLGPLQRGERTERTGTRVRMRPDASIFASTHFDRGLVRSRLEELAIWNPALTFDYLSVPIREPLGTVRWLDRMAAEQGSERGTEAFVRRALRDNVLVDVAAAWSADCIGDVRSFVGQSQTTGDGSHVVGFWQGLADALAQRNPGRFSRSLRGSRARRELRAGLLVVVHVLQHDPRFAGPCRNRLVSDEARDAVRALVGEAFAAHLSQHPSLEAELLNRLTPG